MDQYADLLRRLNPPRRNNFYTGKMMGVAQFEREQRYGMGQRWLMNRLTLGTGILCGLEVAVTSDGKRIRVQPGVAVDHWGREIVVARPVEYDPFKAGGGECGCGDGPGLSEATEVPEGGDDPVHYYVCLTYRECTTDEQPVPYSQDCSGQSDYEPDTTVETFGLSVRDKLEAPKSFKCDDWIAPTGSTPPSVASLRQQLALQFGPACAPPGADSCLAVGQVMATHADDTWRLYLPHAEDLQKYPDPRVRIHTQAQLLEAILCVAECCGGHSEIPIPSPQTLRLQKVEILGLNPELAPPLVGLLSLEDTHPPVFMAGSDDLPASFPRALRITFNQAIDTKSIANPIAGSTSRSIRLARTTKAGMTELQVLAVSEQPNALVVIGIAASLVDDPRHLHGLGAGSVASAMRPLEPGVYTLTLYGHDGGEHNAIKSWPPETSQALDGEWIDRSRFPDIAKSPPEQSGDGKPEGDFEVDFEVRDTLRLIQFDIERAEPQTDGLVHLPWSEAGIQMTLLFNKAVDESSVLHGVEATLPDLSVLRPTIVATGLRKIVLRVRPIPPPVDLAYDVNITLLGSVISEPAEPAAKFDGEPNKAGGLPTGNGVPGGNFNFTLTITQPGPDGGPND